MKSVRVRSAPRKTALPSLANSNVIRPSLAPAKSAPSRFPPVYSLRSMPIDWFAGATDWSDLSRLAPLVSSPLKWTVADVSERSAPTNSRRSRLVVHSLRGDDRLQDRAVRIGVVELGLHDPGERKVALVSFAPVRSVPASFTPCRFAPVNRHGRDCRRSCPVPSGRRRACLCRTGPACPGALRRGRLDLIGGEVVGREEDGRGADGRRPVQWSAPKIPLEDVPANVGRAIPPSGRERRQSERFGSLRPSRAIPGQSSGTEEAFTDGPGGGMDKVHSAVCFPWQCRCAWLRRGRPGREAVRRSGARSRPGRVRLPAGKSRRPGRA